MKQAIIMKNNTFFKLFIIFLIGLSFRLWFLDKPEGLWNDEYVSWLIASQKEWSIFFEKMLSNCHAPLYYFYLKFWMFIFPDSDLSLRWSSVLPSMASIIAMYFAGKELKDKNLGLMCAGFSAISSFCIYFAQEARLYSLVFLLSALTTLFFIKLSKEQTNKNALWYFSLNAILCLTHTLGIIFSAFNIGALFIHLRHEKKKIQIKCAIPFFVVIALLSPFLAKIALSKNLSQFWSDFSLSKILFTMVDYFSPVQTNIQNTHQNFYDLIYNGADINYGFIIFAIIPTAIALLGVINSIKEKNKILNYLLLSAGAFFAALILLSIAGKMILITKYSIEIYPILILACCLGLSKRKILIAVFSIINLFFLLNAQNSAPKIPRTEGHKIVIDMLKNSNLKNNDYVLITYYDKDRFERYLDNSTDYKFSSINKFDFNHHLFNGEDYFSVLKEGKDKYRHYFAKIPNKEIEKYIYSNIISKMKKGDRFGIIALNTVSFIDENSMNEIVNNDDRYEETPLIYLVFSCLKNNLMEVSGRELRLEDISQVGDWTLIVYKKD